DAGEPRPPAGPLPHLPQDVAADEEHVLSGLDALRGRVPPQAGGGDPHRAGAAHLPGGPRAASIAGEPGRGRRAGDPALLRGAVRVREKSLAGEPGSSMQPEPTNHRTKRWVIREKDEACCGAMGPAWRK